MDTIKTYPTPDQIEEQYKFVTYLIGSMEICAEKDDGTEKREGVFLELSLRNVYPIHPVKLESSKTGLTTDEMKEKMIGWVSSGNWELFKEKSRGIWKGQKYIDGKNEIVHIPGDIDYVLMSDWLTFILNRGDKPCVAINTRILMDDLSVQYIQNIKIGDKIKGFTRDNKQTKMVTTEVLSKYFKGLKDTTEIIDDKGNKIICTPDHKFLTRNKKRGSIYTEVSKIEDVFSVKTQDITATYLKGWLIGYLQHDGCFYESKITHRVSCLSDKKEEILKVKEILEFFGFTPCFRIISQNGGIYYETSINKIKEYNILKVWKSNQSAERDYVYGWLAGSIDADGYYEKESIRYTQGLVHLGNISQFEDYCKEVNIKYSKQVRKSRIAFIRGRKIQGSGECVICISKINAFKLISLLDYKRQKLSIGIDRMNSYIMSKTKSKKQEVYDIATTTGNYVAEGFIVHNCGSYGEAFIAMEHNIPVYLITEMPKKELPKSLLQCILVSEGEVFNTLNEYLNFIDNKYHLKRKEPKEDKK